ncbi:MAG TPA: PAS domain S-box protein, partial [Opitutaceae bacterium]|nr:PAS domain S-box protein [Opitutaceae bacterium]
MREKSVSIAWRVVLTYGLVAGLWILVSDRLLAILVGPTPMLTTLSTYKGWAFVAVTGGLLYFALRRWTQRVEEETTAHRQADARLQKSNRALRMLSDCNQCLIHTPNEPELLGRICRSVVETGSFRLAWVGFAENDEAKSVRPVAQYGFTAGYLETVHATWADTERGRGPTGTAIRTGRPCVAQNILTDPRLESWREEARQRGYASSIALPLPGEDRTLGALMIYATEPDAFDSEETGLLTELANDLAFGLQNLRVRAERERSQEAMRASELRYQTLAEVSPVGIFQTDAQGQTIYVNPRWCQIAGLSAPDALHDGWLCAVHPQDRAKLAQGWQEAIKARSVSTADYRFVHPDGSIVWVMGQAAPEKDASGRIAGYVGTITDVTARREVEAALQESEERLRLLGDNLPDSYVYQYIIAADGTPRFLYLSAGVERLHGVKVADTLRDASVLLRQIAPEQLAAMTTAEATSLGSMTDFSMEVEIRRADGHRRWLQLRSRPRRGRDGRVLWDGVATDITERKRAEEAVRELNATLEQRVRHRTAELEVKNKELETFTYSV